MRTPVTMPDLDLGDQPVTASCWLTPVGREVVCGDRILEVAAGAVTVDLPTPISGRLAAQCVLEGTRLEHRQVVAMIETAGDGAS